MANRWHLSRPFLDPHFVTLRSVSEEREGSLSDGSIYLEIDDVEDRRPCRRSVFGGSREHKSHERSLDLVRLGVVTRLCLFYIWSENPSGSFSGLKRMYKVRREREGPSLVLDSQKRTSTVRLDPPPTHPSVIPLTHGPQKDDGKYTDESTRGPHVDGELTRDLKSFSLNQIHKHQLSHGRTTVLWGSERKTVERL